MTTPADDAPTAPAASGPGRVHRSRHRRGSGLTITFAAAACLASGAGPLLAWLGWAKPLTGFMLFNLGALLGLVMLIVGVILVLRKRRAEGLITAALAVIPLVVAVVPAVGALAHPPINDVTTSPDDPPAFVHARTLAGNDGSELAFPPEFAEVIRSAWPDLDTARFDMDPDAVFQRAVELCERRGWKVTRRDFDNREVEAVVRTPVFHFRDDFIARVRPASDAEGGSRVDVRSRSRVGRGDLGANAKRIRAWLADLHARVAGASPGPAPTD